MTEVNVEWKARVAGNGEQGTGERGTGNGKLPRYEQLPVPFPVSPFPVSCSR